MVAQRGDGGFSASVTALSSLLTGDLWRSLRPLQLHLSYMLFHTRHLAMVVGLQITLHLRWKSELFGMETAFATIFENGLSLRLSKPSNVRYVTSPMISFLM